MASLRHKRILAIETSCDESAIAIADFSGAGKGFRVRVHSHIVSSQASLHAAFGGVVPNLARREHERNLVPILLAALRESGIMNHELGTKKARHLHNSEFIIHNSILVREPELLEQFKQHVLPLPPPDIDAIAVTYGPGLAPALWVGVNFARALAVLWQKPLIPTNHMAGHLFSALMQKSGKGNLRFSIPAFQVPLLALLVSGGHTELVLMKKPQVFQIIGQTRDDAVGEAFDKVGRILGLPYPGGPAISELAAQGDAKKYPLPSPMLHSKNYDFSFSGLKTAAFYLIRDLTSKKKLTAQQKADIAASFEKAAIDVLVKKTFRAAREYGARTVLLGGGVAANRALRERLAEEIRNLPASTAYYLPPTTLTGDNALMIAAAAHTTGMKKARDAMDVRAEANLRIDE